MLKFHNTIKLSGDNINVDKQSFKMKCYLFVAIITKNNIFDRVN